METTEQAKSGAWRQWAVDIALPLGLVAVLGVIYGLDRPGPPPAPLPDIETALPEMVAKPLRLGVTPNVPVFDDMGKLLNLLGEGYKFETFPLRDLEDIAKIQKYDIIFLTCSGVPSEWLDTRIGELAREGSQTFTPNSQMLERVHRTLHEFLRQGKTLYASDWHLAVLSGAFPELLNEELLDVAGKAQDVEAEVTEPELANMLQARKVPLRFDQPEWRPAAFSEDKVKVYLKGTFETMEGQRVHAPLLVKFPFHDGTVIFTSFHNEKQNSETELKLLHYLVFSAVLAKADYDAGAELGTGGVSTDIGIFSASSDRPATFPYQSAEVQDLRFVLVFRAQGARLKMTVTGPSGQQYEKEDSKTLVIDVAGAPAGQWTCTIQAIKVPYPNFPYRVKVHKRLSAGSGAGPAGAPNAGP